jgi:predicted RNA-binding Zn-ribbon protein involved in translation (DUF1610 family)
LTERLCPSCKKRHLQDYEEVCSACRYRSMYSFTMSLDPDEQDWEFAHCPECGSSLDGDGVCRNQSCGNSPDVGKDWL